MTKIKSTLAFDVQIKSKDGSMEIIEKSSLQNSPSVKDGTVSFLPEKQNDILWLVNAMVFASTDREDVVMFAPELTIRGNDGKAIAQGGYIDKNNCVHLF